jgi:hypothetical protein
MAQQITPPAPASSRVVADAEGASVPVGVRAAQFQIDISGLPPPMSVEIRVDVSEDGGATWVYFGSTTHDANSPTISDFGIGFSGPQGNTNPSYMVRAKRIVYNPALNELPPNRTPQGEITTQMLENTYV